MDLSEYRNYLGDVNIEYGGAFFDMSDLEYGYVECLRIVDLDSACGLDESVLVERVTIIMDDPKATAAALAFCGQDLDSVDPEYRDLVRAECLLSYGHYDVVSDMSGTHRWILQNAGNDVDARNEFSAEYHEIEDLDVFAWLQENSMLDQFS